MKITKTKLKQLIKEEVKAMLEEGHLGQQYDMDQADAMEGEMTMGDLKFRDSGDFKPGQLTAHQQGRLDALDGKEANPPEDPMRARDYMVGYDSAKDD